MSAGVVVRMWEARVAPGKLAAAQAWLRDVVLVSALDAGAVAAEGFRATGEQERLVAITRWEERADWTEPDPPVGLITRAHGWQFEPIAP